MSRKMRTWARGRDIWKRRAAILCQLWFKKNTDLQLLYDCITPSMKEREFFLIRLRCHWGFISMVIFLVDFFVVMKESPLNMVRNHREC